MTVTIHTATSTQMQELFGRIDMDRPADFSATVREPDFRDTETLTAVWIGPDAAIEVPLNKVGKLAHLVEKSGWLARTGRLPGEDDFGITVALHNPQYAHPAAPQRCASRNAYTLWRAVTDTLEPTTKEA